MDQRSNEEIVAEWLAEGAGFVVVSDATRASFVPNAKDLLATLSAAGRHIVGDATTPPPE